MRLNKGNIMKKLDLLNNEFAQMVETLRQDPKVRTQLWQQHAVLLGARCVRDARMAAGYSQAELARRMGITQPRISSIERADGKDGPTLAMLLRVADACGLELHMDFRAKPVVTAPPRGDAHDGGSREAEGRVVSFPKMLG